MSEGWIKLYRKLLDNPLWTCEPFTRGQAWVDLILLANHEYGYFYKRGIKIDIQRGQVGISEIGLSDRWKWSRTKVKKFLNDLKKEQQILCIQNNITQIVTIIKYEEYQQKEQQTIQQESSRSAAEVQQKNINKNNKEEKNKKNDKDYKKTLLSEIEISDFPELNTDYFKITKSFHELFRNNLIEAGASVTTIDKAKGVWIDEIRMIIEIDKYTPSDLRDVYKFLQTNSFWKKNILSTSTLRKQMDKLKIQIKNESNTGTKRNDTTERRASVDRLRELSIAILQSPTPEKD